MHNQCKHVVCMSFLNSKPRWTSFYSLWWKLPCFGFAATKCFHKQRLRLNEINQRREDVPVLENGRMTPVPATVSISGEDRNKERDVWPGSRADRSPESTAVRERPGSGIWAKQKYHAVSRCTNNMQKQIKPISLLKTARKQDGESTAMLAALWAWM